MSEIMKKIRIAITIDSKGFWAAGGWGYVSYNNGPSLKDAERQMMESSSLDTDCEIAQYWIMAEIEIPQEKEIEEIKGTVDVENT